MGIEEPFPRTMEEKGEVEKNDSILLDADM
jgi:hypothetical protein